MPALNPLICRADPLTSCGAGWEVVEVDGFRFRRKRPSLPASSPPLPSKRQRQESDPSAEQPLQGLASAAPPGSSLAPGLADASPVDLLQPDLVRILA